MARVYQREDWAVHPTRQSGEWEGGEANVTVILHDSVAAGVGRTVPVRVASRTRTRTNSSKSNTSNRGTAT